MDGSSSMKSGHSSWLALSMTQEPTSPSRIILHEHTQFANLPPADSSCMKRARYLEEACHHHQHPPSTSCAYDYLHHDFSKPTDSPIRPDTTAAEIGGRYRQQSSQQGFSPPPMVQDRSPSGDLQHAGKKSSPPPPRHAIRLMGVLMSPDEVAPSLSEMVASNKQDANMFTRPSATFTSRNTADGTTVAPLEDYRLRSLQKETDLISPPGLHDRHGPAITLPQDQTGTGDVTAKTISRGVISGRQAQSPERTGSWEPLKFDVSVFQLPFPDPDSQKIAQIVKLIDLLKKDGQLQMSTAGFRQYSGKVFKNSFYPADRDTTSKIDPNAPLKKRLAASKSLYESRKLWYRRWATMLHDPQRLTDLTLQQQHSTQNETLALMFLFFVEMITSIVTSPDKAENVVNKQLDKALDMLDKLFVPSSLSSLETDILSKRHTQQAGVYPALWFLLERWMYTHRNRFATRIFRPNTDISPVKIFFNTIFYLSIRNLNHRHK